MRRRESKERRHDARFFFGGGEGGKRSFNLKQEHWRDFCSFCDEAEQRRSTGRALAGAHGVKYGELHGHPLSGHSADCDLHSFCVLTVAHGMCPK